MKRTLAESKPDPIRRILIVFLSLIGLVVALLFANEAVTLLNNRRFADSSYYPRVLKVVNSAAPMRREHILRLWVQVVSRTEGDVSPGGLDAILYELGYCTNLRTYAGCKQLPAGDPDEGEGTAKDALHGRSLQYAE